jgi:thiamine-phosphate pyrophosphorylase
VTTPLPRRGLYAITDASARDSTDLVVAVAQALDNGAVVVQYRDKVPADGERRRHEAGALVRLCRKRRVPLIVNDDIVLARDVGADGVHLGREDGAVSEARRILGRDALVGVSCYASLERAENAAAAGADYVAFGAFFPSSTKPGATPVSMAVPMMARTRIDLPIVAIGGITPDNGSKLLASGVDMLAVIHGLFGQDDVRAAARRYAALFDSIQEGGN